MLSRAAQGACGADRASLLSSMLTGVTLSLKEAVEGVFTPGESA